MLQARSHWPGSTQLSKLLLNEVLILAISPNIITSMSPPTCNQHHHQHYHAMAYLRLIDLGVKVCSHYLIPNSSSQLDC